LTFAKPSVPALGIAAAGRFPREESYDDLFAIQLQPRVSTSHHGCFLAGCAGVTGLDHISLSVAHYPARCACYSNTGQLIKLTSRASASNGVHDAPAADDDDDDEKAWPREESQAKRQQTQPPRAESQAEGRKATPTVSAAFLALAFSRRHCFFHRRRHHQQQEHQWTPLLADARDVSLISWPGIAVAGAACWVMRDAETDVVNPGNASAASKKAPMMTG